MVATVTSFDMWLVGVRLNWCVCVCVHERESLSERLRANEVDVNDIGQCVHVCDNDSKH